MLFYLLTGVIAKVPNEPSYIPPDIVAGPFQASQTKRRTKITGAITGKGVVTGTTIQ